MDCADYFLFSFGLPIASASEFRSSPLRATTPRGTAAPAPPGGLGLGLGLRLAGMPAGACLRNPQACLRACLKHACALQACLQACLKHACTPQACLKHACRPQAWLQACLRDAQACASRHAIC